jgi:predicted CXXCH cytochrome family protein
MRKTLMVSLITLLAVILTYGLALAISGQCVNCHTMHNSQDGLPMATGGPFPQLLRASCIGCHTQNGAAQGATNTFPAPIVYHTTLPGGQGGSFTLAGGDFYWVADASGNTDSTGHNVSGIAGPDLNFQPNIGLNPPGWDADATPGILADGQIATGAANWSSQLTCDGIYGCHGEHDASGVTGAHHSNTGLTTTRAENPTTVGGSYRFLGGINGLEDDDWNWDESSTEHNEYFGVNGNVNYANKRTINYSCAQCHGVFHSQIDDATAGSPWLRHPTDVDLPATGEYATYNPDGGNLYSVEAPVARATVPISSGSTVTPGTDIVMCLSCHRAHGSPQPDILRWDYTTMLAATGTADTGCFRCHTTKNAD